LARTVLRYKNADLDGKEVPLNARLVLLAMSILVGSQAFANTSVWDEAKREAYQVTGKIVSIATNDTEILVRISDGHVTETYKVCSSYPGGDGLNMVEGERMKSIRDAFNHGETVKASYNSPFDRCLSSVELSKEPKPDKIAHGAVRPASAFTKADHGKDQEHSL
jgi:hypothetical protein